MSWESEIIPGHAEAVESERLDRAIAFLPLSELIAGVECEPLTPYRMEWLKAGNSPFIVGGKLSSAAVVQFLWIVNQGFSTHPLLRHDFIQEHLNIDYEQAVTDINAYLDRAFLDAPEGGEGASYYSAAAGLIVAMSGEPFHWKYSQVIHMPLRVTFQLLKAHTRNQGGSVINRRSQKIECDWLDTITPQPKKEHCKTNG